MENSAAYVADPKQQSPQVTRKRLRTNLILVGLIFLVIFVGMVVTSFQH